LGFSLPPKDDLNFLAHSLYGNICWAPHLFISFDY